MGLFLCQAIPSVASISSHRSVQFYTRRSLNCLERGDVTSSLLVVKFFHPLLCTPPARSAAPLRFKNMVRGGEFSDALLSLELNIGQVRESLCVLDFGLTAGGPRPYQDPRSHHWCMLRLRRLLGPGPLAGVGGADDVNAELADVTVDLMGVANAAALVPHLIDGLKDEEEDVGETPSAREVRTAAATLGAQVRGLKAYWPCLRELTLSCGIMRGDLEGLAACFGR